MRVVIVRAQDVVIVDGKPHDVNCGALAVRIYVIEWNGTRGHIEYVNDPHGSSDDYLPNEVIDDFSPYQYLLDAWQYAEDHPPPPPKPPGPSAEFLVRQSFFASQARAADELAATGDVYGAVKLLLNIQ